VFSYTVFIIVTFKKEEMELNSLNVAIKTLESSEFKATGKRKKMLEILYDQDKYLSAKDIQCFLETTFPNISPDTIYRNLHTFVSMDILEQTELGGEKLFRSNCEVDEHHHHFICTECGNTKEIDNCPIDNLKTQLPGCTVTSHRFELYGKCENCQIA